MIPMYHIHVSSMFSSSPEYRLEDALDAFKEIGESGELAAALCCTIARLKLFLSVCYMSCKVFPT